MLGGGKCYRKKLKLKMGQDKMTQEREEADYDFKVATKSGGFHPEGDSRAKAR